MKFAFYTVIKCSSLFSSNNVDHEVFDKNNTQKKNFEPDRNEVNEEFGILPDRELRDL